MNRTRQSIINNICVDDHLGLAYKEAKRAKYLTRDSIELDELISIATIALCQAAGRFEHGRGIPFESFARFRIRGHLIDGIGVTSRVPRKMFRNLARDRARGRCTPLITHTGYDDETAFPQLSAEQNECESSFELQVIRRLVASLPPRSADLLRLVYFEGRTLSEAANRLGISQTSASRLRKRCFGLLRTRIDLSSPRSAPNVVENASAAA